MNTLLTDTFSRPVTRGGSQTQVNETDLVQVHVSLLQ